MLREHLIGATVGPVIIDAIDLFGSRPDTLVVFRCHHHPAYVGRHADLVPGPRAEAARLWEFAMDHDPYAGGMKWRLRRCSLLAATIGSAFDAAELPLVDPVTLTSIGVPPRIFPRVMSDAAADHIRRMFEAQRSAREGRSAGAPPED